MIVWGILLENNQFFYWYSNIHHGQLQTNQGTYPTREPDVVRSELDWARAIP